MKLITIKATLNLWSTNWCLRFVYLTFRPDLRGRTKGIVRIVMKLITIKVALKLDLLSTKWLLCLWTFKSGLRSRINFDTRKFRYFEDIFHKFQNDCLCNLATNSFKGAKKGVIQIFRFANFVAHANFSDCTAVAKLPIFFILCK